jgi:hypothetical protein
VVGEEAGRRTVFVGGKVQTEIGSPTVATERGRDGLFAMINELGEDFVVLLQ